MDSFISELHDLCARHGVHHSSFNVSEYITVKDSWGRQNTSSNGSMFETSGFIYNAKKHMTKEKSLRVEFKKIEHIHEFNL